MCDRCVARDAEFEALKNAARDRGAIIIAERKEKDHIQFLLVQDDSVEIVATVSGGCASSDVELHKAIAEAVDAHVRRLIAQAGVSILAEERTNLAIKRGEATAVPRTNHDH